MCDDIIVYLAVVGIEAELYLYIRIKCLKILYRVLIYFHLSSVCVVLSPEGQLIITRGIKFIRHLKFTQSL